MRGIGIWFCSNILIWQQRQTSSKASNNKLLFRLEPDKGLSCLTTLVTFVVTAAEKFHSFMVGILPGLSRPACRIEWNLDCCNRTSKNHFLQWGHCGASLIKFKDIFFEAVWLIVSKIHSKHPWDRVCGLWWFTYIYDPPQVSDLGSHYRLTFYESNEGAINWGFPLILFVVVVFVFKFISI